MQIGGGVVWGFYDIYMYFFRTGSRLKSHRQDCGTMVRCRQKCTNRFPVPQGSATCSGMFEGDSCTVVCGRHYRHRGDSKAYCTGGVWTIQRGGGRTASAHCVSVGAYYSRFSETHHKGRHTLGNIKQRHAVPLVWHLRFHENNRLQLQQFVPENVQKMRGINVTKCPQNSTPHERLP